MSLALLSRTQTMALYCLWTGRGEPTAQAAVLACTVISQVNAHGYLKVTGQKTGVGVYTEKPLERITHIHTDHRIIKKWGGRLHGDGRLLGRIRYVSVLRHTSPPKCFSPIGEGVASWSYSYLACLSLAQSTAHAHMCSFTTKSGQKVNLSTPECLLE